MWHCVGGDVSQSMYKIRRFIGIILCQYGGLRVLVLVGACKRLELNLFERGGRFEGPEG